MGHIADGKTVIDIVHNMIHEGRSFIVTDYDSDVDIAGPKYYRMTTPAGDTQIHFAYQFYANAAGTLEFFENPTINAAGTAMTAYNMYRHSSSPQAATLVVRYDATTTADGTRLWVGRIGTSGNPAQTTGGGNGMREEFVLRANEDYILKFTTDADNNKTWVDLVWYEILEK